MGSPPLLIKKKIIMRIIRVIKVYFLDEFSACSLHITHTKY